MLIANKTCTQIISRAFSPVLKDFLGMRPQARSSFRNASILTLRSGFSNGFSPSDHVLKHLAKNSISGLEMGNRSLPVVPRGVGLDWRRTQAFSVAPMMEYTDRHQRYLFRLLSKKAVLYTEMVTANALVHMTDPLRALGTLPFQSGSP